MKYINGKELLAVVRLYVLKSELSPCRRYEEVGSSQGVGGVECFFL